MRRGSFVFPLILILVGVLFLVHNMMPNLSVLGFVAQYWPFLFVLWGVLRSAELIFSYLKGESLPTYGLSGGAWVLVIFLLVTGGGISAANRLSNEFSFGRFAIRGLETFGEGYDFPVTASAPSAGATRIVVENLRGNARIVGGDVTEVKVTGRTTVRAYSEPDAKKQFDKAQLTVVNQAGQISVRTNHDAVSGDAQASSDLEITVPKNITVECRGRYGDFEIQNIIGEVQVDSENAGVRMQDITGRVNIDLRRSDVVRAARVKGDVTVKGRGSDLQMEEIDGKVEVVASYSGDLEFRAITKNVRYESSQSTVVIEKIPGYVRLSRGELTGAKVAGPVRIQSRSKDVRLSEFTGPLEIDVDRGDLEVYPGTTPLSAINLKTRNGDIEIGMPDGAKFDLRAKTDRGEADNEYGSPLSQSDTGRAAEIRGSVGTGPAVVMESGRGRITVRKAAAPSGDWDLPAVSTPPKVPSTPNPVKPPSPASPAAPPAAPPKVTQQ